MYNTSSETEETMSRSVIGEEVKGVQPYLLAEVERWDIGLVNVMRHSRSSPARNTGPRAMEATTSIICNVTNPQRYVTKLKIRNTLVGYRRQITAEFCVNTPPHGSHPADKWLLF